VCAEAGSALQLLQYWLGIENTLKGVGVHCSTGWYLPIFFGGQERGDISQRLRGLQGLQGLRFCHIDALFQEIESRLQSKLGEGGGGGRARREAIEVTAGEGERGN